MTTWVTITLSGSSTNKSRGYLKVMGQLKTTKMFWTAKETLGFITAPAMASGMDKVRKFSFDKGLLGEGATSVDAIGITFPGGKTLGNPKNIKLRYDETYVKMAADGKL